MRFYYTIFIQIAVWMVIMSIPVYLLDSVEKPPGLIWMIFSRIVLLATFFNLVYYAISPLYFSGKKRAFYWLAPLLYAGYVALSVISDLYIPSAQIREALALPNPEFGGDKMFDFTYLPSILSGLLIFGIASALRGFSEFEKKKKDEDNANRRRLEAELALLKSQINPHFLLNSLNNIYALSLTDTEKVPLALLKLSDMVRYILYECNKPKIELEKDLEFVHNFIALQQLRLPKNVMLLVDLPTGNFAREIEPMILIPFIENAFKHGLTTKYPCVIFISIKIEANRLVLEVENDIFPQKTEENRTESGIGLANTRQRLERGYTGKYLLDIKNNGKKHRVELIIYL